jgi:hypothetical protein
MKITGNYLNGTLTWSYKFKLQAKYISSVNELGCRKTPQTLTGKVSSQNFVAILFGRYKMQME